MMIDVILMDIEGTTTSISFVHDVLFPYARKQFPRFIAENAGDPVVIAALQDVKATAQEEGLGQLDTDGAVNLLLSWIDADRKHGALKRLQGMVWKTGYEQGDYTAHLYQDVKPCWEAWRQAGKTLAIYSSGSVPAQKLLFGYTAYGDLNGFLSAYFDTSSGHKREAQSYRNIQAELAVSPDRILFLSDVPEELDAAREAGYQTTQLVRPGTNACNRHPTVSDFNELKV